MVQTKTSALESYETISYDDLVTYVVYMITANNSRATFEDIVAKAFQLFPKRFNLRGYPQWPDSSVVDKSWLRARTDKHYIVGSVREGFKLTRLGLQVATRIERELGKKPVRGSRKLQSELRTNSGRLLRSVENSDSFQGFAKTGSLDHVAESDLSEVLLALPDATPKRLSGNLAQFQDAAELYERPDIRQFLLALVKKFPRKFTYSTKCLVS